MLLQYKQGTKPSQSQAKNIYFFSSKLSSNGKFFFHSCRFYICSETSLYGDLPNE